MSWKKESPAVYYSSQASVSAEDLAALKRRAPKRGRVRLCLHEGPDAALHEMLIALPRGEYVRPHQHARRGETYHILEGAALFLEFDAKGRVTRRVKMGAKPGLPFLHKQRAGVYHSLLVLTPWLVFRETKLGPLRPSESWPAPWSPEPSDVKGVEKFMRGLR